jgi:predicted GNAT family acetyltransferase
MTPQLANLTERRSNGTSAWGASPCLYAHEIIEDDKTEVLEFLARRPIHTVVMSGLIHDNGIESWLNRGTFYGYWNDTGSLEGVSLIGHGMFMEARSEDALMSFARLAQVIRSTHMILGEQENVQRFWQSYSGGGQSVRIIGRAVLFECSAPVSSTPIADLRLARPDDLPLIAPIHAAMAMDESGINPLEVDGEGFRMRCARRIRQERTWAWIEDGRVIFKADLISETPEAAYLEGVYVAPHQRDRGYGTRCLSEIARTLLRRTKTVVLLVNEQRRDAHRFFRRVGFEPRSLYETVFLQPPERSAIENTTMR